MAENTDKTSWLQSNYYFILRFVLVAAACVLFAVALVMMTLSTRESSRAQQLAVDMVQSEKVADTLLLASFDSSDAPTQMQYETISDLLNRTSVSVDVSYLDAADKGRGYYSADILSNSSAGVGVAAKLEEHGSYDCIICLDDEALAFVIKNYNQLFSGTPVVFFGINDEDNALAAYNSGYATGLIEGYDTTRFLETVTSLQPNASKLVAITDNTDTGAGIQKQFAQAVASFPNLSVEYINASTLTRAGLGEAVSNVGDDTILLYLCAHTDVEGNGYSTDSSARFLDANASQPIYSVGFNGVGEGFAGSDYVDYIDVAESAGNLVVSVLNGNNPTDTPIQVYQSDGSVFDVEQIHAAGISASSLPPNSTLIYESGVNMDSVRPILFPIILLVIGGICIAAFAVLGYKRSALVTQQIMRQGNMLEQRFYINKVTETPNMQWLTTFASSEDAKRVRSILALSLLGIKTIDDSFGPGTADEVAKQLAERLGGIETLFLVQASEDEFILGMKHDLKLGDELLETVKYLIKQPFDVDGQSIEVRACIAVCNREHIMSLEEMVSGVEIAISQAVQIGSTEEIIFYDRDLRRAIEDNLEITAELKKAIANEDFYVVYQPQIELSSNKVIGYEALARLKGEKYSPEEFFAIAELNGQIIEIDRIISQKVVQQLAKWKRRKQRMRTVTINHGLGQLRDKEYIEFMTGLMERYNLSPSLVCFDLKESLFINNMSTVLGFADELKNAGFGISIDGFGAGYMSVQRVMSLPAEVIKIDGTLTQSFLLDGDDGVVGNLVRLIHSAGKTVAIEGVETLSQVMMCRALDCDIVQGFFFSEPMLPERAVQFSPPEQLIGVESVEEETESNANENDKGDKARKSTKADKATSSDEELIGSAVSTTLNSDEELIGSAVTVSEKTSEELIGGEEADVDVSVSSEVVEEIEKNESDDKSAKKQSGKYSAAAKKSNKKSETESDEKAETDSEEISEKKTEDASDAKSDEKSDESAE